MVLTLLLWYSPLSRLFDEPLHALLSAGAVKERGVGILRRVDRLLVCFGRVCCCDLKTRWTSIYPPLRSLKEGGTFRGRRFFRGFGR